MAELPVTGVPGLHPLDRGGHQDPVSADRQSLLVREKHRVVNTGAVRGDIVVYQGTAYPSVRLELPFAETGPDARLLDLLCWKGRLSPFLGREEKVNSLLEWATGGPGIRARVITGPGGVGKTRLAAQLAEDLRMRGWEAGFVRLPKGADPAAGFGIPVGAAGSLLIVDYPEERGDTVRKLLRHTGGTDPQGVSTPICLLLLTRKDAEAWGPEVATCGADGLFGEPITLGPLAGYDDPFSLFTGTQAKAREILAGRGRPAPPVEEPAFRTWLERDPLHRLPLLTLACAVHHTLEPDTLDRSGPDIIDALVEREIKWLFQAGRSAGLDGEALPRLSALAAIAGGLSAGFLKRLADRSEALELSLPPRSRIVDTLRETHVLSGTDFPSPEPDIVAARLVVRVLADRNDVAGEWLWASIEPQEGEPPERLQDDLSRLGRLIYDAEQVLGLADAHLGEWLAATVIGQPDRCHILAEPFAQANLPFGLVPVSVCVWRTLADTAPNDEARAVALDHLSSHLSNLGLRAEALGAIEKAVAVRRRLAAARPDACVPDLARSLKDLSNRLSGLGRREEALEAIEQAVAAYRKLAQARPDAFLPNLAISLTHLSTRLSELGRRKEALGPIEEAIAAYRKLGETRPDAFLPDLATSLNNLSNRLSSLGRREEALGAIHEAIDVRRRLAKASPDAFLPILARSLNNLSTNLSALGRRKDALGAIEEAVVAYRKLAAARPDAFLPNLAGSLTNLSTCLSGLGRQRDALLAVEEAVAVYCELAEARSETFNADFAASLTSLSDRFWDLGQRVESLEPLEKAVAIRRTLAEARPGALADFAKSLTHLATRFSDLRRGEEGLGVIDEAIAAYRKLAETRPDTFLPALAMSLSDLSNFLFQLGLEEKATRALDEAEAILERLDAKAGASST